MTTSQQDSIPTETLSKCSHTPGPWEYWPAQNYDGFAIAPRGTLPTLASVERCGHQVNVQVHNFPGSTKANARLIAAAPDLLDALRQLIAISDRNHDAWDAAHAAIAKAEGRS